ENDFGGHDFFHTLRVYNMAVKIAQKEGADLTIVGLSALLHDVDDRKLSPATCANKDNARSFLMSNGVDNETIETICKIIGEIAYAGTDSVVPSTIEGKCVQDADRLDAIGAVGIGRAFAYGGSHNRYMHNPDIAPKLNMTAEEYHKSNSTTINHFYEKIFNLADMMNTESAKIIAESRERYMKEFVDIFLQEWDGVR
ncbi:MAG: HD domain-containing protein, partial [Clostridia bacterium]|nr:HD domain-containing protein [Clostridia bacterium]